MARKNRSPMPIFSDDFITDVNFLALSEEEKGVLFIALLFINSEKKLSHNEKFLANLFRISPKKLRRLLHGEGKVFERFFKVEGDYLISPYLEEQWEKQRRWREKSSLGGRHSWESRSRNGSDLVQTKSEAKGEPEGEPNAEPKVNSYILYPNTEPNPIPPPPSPSQRDVAAKEGMGVSSQSKFSIELRRAYRDAHGLGNGWLVKSETGKYDTHIEEWIQQGKPDRSKPRRSKYATDREELAPNRFAERARQRRDEQLNRSVTAEPSPPVEPQRNGAPPLALQGATASEHSGEIAQRAPVEPCRPDNFFDEMEGQPS